MEIVEKSPEKNDKKIYDDKMAPLKIKEATNIVITE